jgi:hypothetical protein
MIVRKFDMRSRIRNVCMLNFFFKASLQKPLGIEVIDEQRLALNGCVGYFSSSTKVVSEYLDFSPDSREYRPWIVRYQFCMVLTLELYLLQDRESGGVPQGQPYQGRRRGLRCDRVLSDGLQTRWCCQANTEKVRGGCSVKTFGAGPLTSIPIST